MGFAEFLRRLIIRQEGSPTSSERLQADPAHTAPAASRRRRKSSGSVAWQSCTAEICESRLLLSASPTTEILSSVAQFQIHVSAEEIRIIGQMMVSEDRSGTKGPPVTPQWQEINEHLIIANPGQDFVVRLSPEAAEFFQQLLHHLRPPQPDGLPEAGLQNSLNTPKSGGSRTIPLTEGLDATIDLFLEIADTPASGPRAAIRGQFSPSKSLKLSPDSRPSERPADRSAESDGFVLDYVVTEEDLAAEGALAFPSPTIHRPDTSDGGFQLELEHLEILDDIIGTVTEDMLQPPAADEAEAGTEIPRTQDPVLLPELDTSVPAQPGLNSALEKSLSSPSALNSGLIRDQAAIDKFSSNAQWPDVPLPAGDAEHRNVSAKTTSGAPSGNWFPRGRTKLRLATTVLWRTPPEPLSRTLSIETDGISIARTERGTPADSLDSTSSIMSGSTPVASVWTSSVITEESAELPGVFVRRISELQREAIPASSEPVASRTLKQHEISLKLQRSVTAACAAEDEHPQLQPPDDSAETQPSVCSHVRQLRYCIQARAPPSSQAIRLTRCDMHAQADLQKRLRFSIAPRGPSLTFATPAKSVSFFSRSLS